MLKTQLLSNYQLHCQLLETKTTKTCQIKFRQENNRSQCSVVNLILILISFLNVYSHLYICLLYFNETFYKIFNKGSHTGKAKVA